MHRPRAQYPAPESGRGQLDQRLDHVSAVPSDGSGTCGFTSAKPPSAESGLLTGPVD